MSGNQRVIIVGGGAAGLSAALGLAESGLEVTVLGLPEAIIDEGRSAALFETSLAFLDRLGAGDALRSRGAPLRAIRIVDITDSLIRAPDVTFRAAEIGQEAFGWNIPNAAILDVLIGLARRSKSITLSTERFSGLSADAGGVAVTDSTGLVHHGAVLIGADGQNSRVRVAADITHREKAYPQVALTARLKHTGDHLDESLEFHTREGPFTFVPVSANASALVWIMRPEKADAMLALPADEIARRAEKHSFHALGRLTIEGWMGRVPMRRIVADKLVADRVALVGEAAHAFPPIGAQGLNLGLRDVAALVSRLADANATGKDIGSADVLSGYARERRVDVEARTAGVDILNSALIDDTLAQDILRAFGLSAMRNLGPVRQLAMRLGGGLNALPAFRLPDLRPPFLR